MTGWRRGLAAALLGAALVAAAAPGGTPPAAAALNAPSAPRQAAAAPPGKALGWGFNVNGELGDGTRTTSSIPVQVHLPAGATVTAVAAGGNHSLAVTSTGQVLAWGSNSNGQLGDGTKTMSSTPVQVRLPAGVTVTAVAAGGTYSLALTATGQVLAWGSNAYGQLGDGTKTDTPIPVEVNLPAGTTVTAVAAGYYQSLALTSSGQALAWGYNVYGELGDGTKTNRTAPVQVSLPAGTTVTAIAGGYYHSLALTSTGQVLAWGYNSAGQLGDGTKTTSSIPVQVRLPAETTVTALGAGAEHSLALTSTGQVLAWGSNGYGQLGDATTTTRTAPVQVRLPAGTTVTVIAAGYYHSLALTSTGQVLAWGRNSNSELGDGTTTNRTAPVQVRLPADTTVTAIAGGQRVSLAVAPPIAIDITKTADVDSFAKAGTPVTYTYTVTVTGLSPVDGVTVRDDKLPGGIACDLGALVPDLPATCRATYQATAADVAAGQVRNTAFAAGTAPGGTPVRSDDDSLPVPLIEHPAIAMTKTADAGSFAEAGTPLIYTYTVTNNGDVPLHDVTVTDSTLGPVCNFAAIPAPGTATCTASYIATPQDVTASRIGNTASATGTTPGGTTVTSPPDSLTIPLSEHPAIAITKTAGLGSFARTGTPLAYTYTVTNNGNVPLHEVTVTDSKLGAVCGAPFTLPLTAVRTCTARYAAAPADVTAGTIANSAAATALTPAGTSVQGSQVALDIPRETAPAVSITKKASPGSFTAPGQLVTYTYTVTNNGDVPLHDVTVTDSELGAVCGPPFTLPAAASRTCTATYRTTPADITAGTITTSVAATALTPAGTPVHGPQVALDIPRETAPAISITKKASPGSFTAPGQPLTYTYTITNNGDVPLLNVTVTDSKLGAVCGPPFTLPAADARTCTARYRTTPADLTAGTITNTATATGTTPAGAPVNSETTLAVPLTVPVTG